MKLYAYLVIDTSGIGDERFRPGEYLLEPEYKWSGDQRISLMDDRDTISGTVTLRYVTEVFAEDGRLDESSAAQLDASRETAGLKLPRKRPAARR